MHVGQVRGQRGEAELTIIVQAARHGKVIALEQGYVGTSGGISRVGQVRDQRREVTLTRIVQAAIHGGVIAL